MAMRDIDVAQTYTRFAGPAAGHISCRMTQIKVAGAIGFDSAYMFGRIVRIVRRADDSRGSIFMSDVVAVLTQLETTYRAAVEAWIAAIKHEEALVSTAPESIEDLDKWEEAHFKEDDARNKVIELKRQYEDALREKFFHF
jgi:hypothetical protein